MVLLHFYTLKDVYVRSSFYKKMSLTPLSKVFLVNSEYIEVSQSMRKMIPEGEKFEEHRCKV